MTLSAGEKLGPYEIISKLGAGGMGEVYKARDTRLDRFVAVKVLPEHIAKRADLRQRFEREARAVASLNHPHICVLFDIGNHEGADFMVMECLEGETLAERIGKGAIPLDQALAIAAQIADALDRAHSAGVTHRDVKPGNVMLTRDGVKVLDFGLAQLIEPDEAGEAGATVAAAAPLTEVGTVLGTAAYMSPEQARGQRLDARTDIFSLGVVLYQMIAGTLPFRGVNALDVIISILQKEPAPLTQQVAGVPRELERLLGKTLRKDREQRYQSAKELLLDLKDLQEEMAFAVKLQGSAQAKEVEPLAAPPEIIPASHPSAAPATSSTQIILGEVKRHKLGVGLTLALLLAGAALSYYGFFARRGDAPIHSLALQAVPLTTLEGTETTPTLSPDGSQVAFSWDGESGGNFDIYIQVIGAGSPHRLTTDPAQDTAPAWSPDGRYIAFIRSTGEKGEGAIYLVPPLGGSERKVTEGVFLRFQNSWPTRLGWSPDGKTLFLSEMEGEAQGIYSFEVETGKKRRLTSPPPYGDYSLAVSPDGETVAFARITEAGFASSIYVAPIHGGEPRLLAPPPGGFLSLTWMPDGKEIVYGSTEAMGFTPSLWKIAAAGGEPRRLPILGEGGIMPVISPFGRRLVYVRRTRNANIWRYDRPQRDGDPWQRRKVISSTYLEISPQISPDGKRIVFASTKSGRTQIWIAESDGSNQHQLTSLEPFAGSPRWSPDGRSIVFDARPKGTSDIYVVDAQGGAPRPLVAEAGHQDRPSWSHDGKWIYFGSDHTGKRQIWKVPAGGGNLIQLTRGGGGVPFESADGRFVYYAGPVERTVWRVPVEGGEEVAVLTTGLSAPDRWDVTNDGIYFVAEERDASSRRSWVLNLFRFDTQKVSVVTKLDRPTFVATPLDVSPDGKWFVWAQGDRDDSDLMLVENFR